MKTIYILVPTTNYKTDQVTSETKDNHLNLQVATSEYGRDENDKELKNVLTKMGREYVLLHTTLDNYSNLFVNMTEEERKNITVLNFCDGTEKDTFPGISVIKHLDKLKMNYSGSNETFFETSSSKIKMKQLFDKAKVPTAPWSIVSGSESKEQIEEKLKNITYPAILKPDNSYCSCGINIDSVVFNAEQALKQIQKLEKTFVTVFVEKFIAGREFTCLVTGHCSEPQRATLSGCEKQRSCFSMSGSKKYGIETYEVLERVFDTNLPKHEQFISVDMFWQLNRKTTNDEFWYKHAPNELQDKLQNIAEHAYNAVGGNGYARVDMRMDENKNIYVLEVNAQCGISGDSESIIGKILEYTARPFTYLIESFIEYAENR